MEVKLLNGIDSLYYFAESNENYDDLFLEILDQIEDAKGKFEKKEIEFENSDVHILVNEIPLSYLGCQEAFHWFKDINEYFRIGFKDSFKRKGLNDIRVQLQGVGIYAIGIKTLVEFINNVLLRHYVTGYYPITRVDLNCFIQHDFSFISKEMFSTRKRNYSTISEIGSHKELQTIYVGKSPFKLRLYNKKEELKKSSKKDLMYEYFENNGFDLEEPIFNVEFEIQRTHLRNFNILTIDDLFENAVNLFKQSMVDIRLIDISNITQKDIENNSKSRATTLPIWDYIKESYDLKDFLQIQLPLQRVKRKISIYDDVKFKLEFISLIRKAYINNLHLDSELLNSYLKLAKESFTKSPTMKQLKKRYTEVEIIHPNGQKEQLRLVEDGNLIKPLSVQTVALLQDYDLHVYLEKTQENQNKSTKDKHIYEVALKEAIKRGLIPNISPNEV